MRERLSKKDYSLSIMPGHSKWLSSLSFTIKSHKQRAERILKYPRRQAYRRQRRRRRRYTDKERSGRRKKEKNEREREKGRQRNKKKTRRIFAALPRPDRTARTKEGNERRWIKPEINCVIFSFHAYGYRHYTQRNVQSLPPPLPFQR